MLAHDIPQHGLNVDERLVPVDIWEPQLDQDRADVLVFALYRALRAAIQQITERSVVGGFVEPLTLKFRSQHIEIVSNSGFDLLAAPNA